MATIVPTITAFSPEEYNQQLQKIAFAKRIHPDFTDGIFAPSKTVNLIEAHWLKDQVVDLHVMYQKPAKHLETLISLNPTLVILHAEAQGELTDVFGQLKAVGIKTGLAILPDTAVASVASLIKQVEHVLIFGGRLGYQGSELQTEQLVKVNQAKDIKPELELGWDGGVNDVNIRQVAAAGTNVINVGGYLQKAKDPKQAYDKLEQILKGVGSDSS